MSFKNPVRIDGELLRSLREAQGLDITLLSRQVNLSVAQLRELESAGSEPAERSLFYSQAIKDSAAKKVALRLGADPEALMVAGANGQAQSDASSPMQVLDDLALLLEKQKPSQPMMSRAWVTRSAMVSLGLLLCLMGAWAWYVQKPWPPVERSRLSEAAPAAPSVVKTPDSQEETAPVSAPVAMRASLSLQPDASCPPKSGSVTLKPALPSKAGNMVYIVALADMAVCVQDGAGKTMAVGLKAQESRSFYGAAPWTVQFEKPSQAQLFFQGQRLRWPEGELDTFILHEVPGTY